MPHRTLADRRPYLAGILLTLALALLFALASTPPAGAAVCSRGNAPASTLLVPYFEVDLASPGGKTTLFSVGSVASEPTLVRITIWSDWGIPLWGFHVVVPPDGVQTINMRDVLQLQVPSFLPEQERFPGCFTTLPPPGPEITPEQLQQRLTGVASEGTCYSRPRGETDLAVGFVTVDALSDCDLTLPAPIDPTYVEIASSANVLWGDVFYVDPDDDSAQGISAVALPSVAETRPDSPHLYLDRLSPDDTWRARFLSGGPLDTSTEVVVWLADFSFSFFRSGVDCGGITYPTASTVYLVRSGPESGPLTEPRRVDVEAVTAKLTVGELLGNGLPIGGSFELQVGIGIDGLGGFTDFPIPIVVGATHRAAGRFSVGVEATPIDGPCFEPTF